MGRKMRINEGASFNAFMVELKVFCQKNMNHPILKKEIGILSDVVKRLGEVATKMSEQAKSDPLQWASYTYPALLCFGDVTAAWRLLDMAVIAQRAIDEDRKSDFYVGKVMQATYFTNVTLPLTMARSETCLREGREVVDMPEKAF
jgi:hypothetical protein